jgi:Tol biopolymer transport system component
VVAWLSDGESLLVSARRNRDDSRGLWQMDATDGALRRLLAADYLRNVRLSPDGTRIAYVRAPEPNPDLAGLWVLDIATLATIRMPLAGSYAWHPSGDGLIVIPARESGQETHTLWWIDAADGVATPLTSPETAPLRISNLEWVLSPDGDAIAYRGADFLGLWVLNFGLSLDAILTPAPRTILSQSE